MRREDPAVRAVLNRPERRNAMGAAMMEAVGAPPTELEADRGGTARRC